jgi:hypothetical protein
VQRDALAETYTSGAKRHFGDRYRGDLEGDYAALSVRSDSFQLYHEAAFSLTSVKAYQQKRFPVPFILNLAAHAPLRARNSPDERFIELSISSFFSTPMARQTSPATAEQRAASRRARRSAH